MKKRRAQVDIRIYFILISMVEIVFTVGVSSWIAELLNVKLVSLHPILWLLILGAVVGLCVSVAINQLLLFPILKLTRAMRKVAKGDFTVELETKTPVRQVQDMYSDFNLMVKALSSTETLQSDFISNVSHEFKTPINAIEGYTTLLQGESCTPEQAGYVNKILLNTRRLSTLVGNILLLSRVDNQNLSVERSQYRLDEQIRQAIVLLEPKWTEKDIEFDAELEEITWYGAESLMHHVWSNLIGNAVKFDPPGGWVRLRLFRTGQGIVFTIEDNGPGIPEEEQDAIFGKFYQADSSHRQEGNGLGLALCRQILTIEQGTIQVENRQKGCCFTVTLPDSGKKAAHTDRRETA